MMEANGFFPPPTNLTGQVALLDIAPKFNGNYSSVYLGDLNESFVAIKVIKGVGDAETIRRKVLREVTIWASTNHPNIYPFYGVIDDRSFAPFGALISPWCLNGDATQYLKEHGQQMVMADRINLWEGIIDGVVYLHDQDPPIVHGDLKPGNVLIDENGKPRICDFGLSRIFLEQGSSGLTTKSDHTGTERYLAPELVMSDTNVPPTQSSDVYALGCLGLELVLLRIPFANRLNNARGHIFQDLRRGMPPAAEEPRLYWPSHRIWPLITSCWTPDPLLRPPAFHLAYMLKRTALTFPPVVMKRIIYFVDAIRLHWDDCEAWKARTRSLHSLCLVSQACWIWATPFIYRNIRIYLDKKPSGLSALIYTLTNSKAKPLTFSQAHGGYGTYTRTLALVVREGFSQEALSTQLRAALRMMNGLQSAFICNSLFIRTQLPLTTLHIEDISISFLLDQRTTLQALYNFQRLRIEHCFQSGSADHDPMVASFRVFLPNLQAIKICSQTDEVAYSKLLGTFAGWTMPNLRLLDIYCPEAGEGSIALLTFLWAHGALLQHLTLNIEDYLIAILPPCHNLRSIEVVAEELPPPSILDRFRGHANLEMIRVVTRKYTGCHRDQDCGQYKDPNFERCEEFRSAAAHRFPKLKEVQVGWLRESDDLDDLEDHYRVSVLFRLADDFILFSDGRKRYRRYDGRNRDIGRSICLLQIAELINNHVLSPIPRTQ